MRRTRRPAIFLAPCPLPLYNPVHYESDLSSFTHSASAHAWISQADANGARPPGSPTKATKRPQTPNPRLVRRVGSWVRLEEVPGGAMEKQVLFVISKKYLPRAVDRNRLKRMIRGRLHASAAGRWRVVLRRRATREGLRRVCDEVTTLAQKSRKGGSENGPGTGLILS